MILLGDCRERMAEMEESSIDAIVCDPPYELGFMGKKWDGSGIAYDQEVWRQAWRVLKPGGYILAFGGSRTYHRLACAIEDAGFEIRDCISWVYGSGFPKSLDVSKAIDRAAGAEREVIGQSEVWGNNAKGGRGGQYANGPALPADGSRKTVDITAPATDAARQWDGWGTALKPSHEPIVMARKTLSEKTVAANVLRWGCGAVNVDGCRIGTGDILSSGRHVQKNRTYPSGYKDTNRSEFVQNPSGRWPANLILGHAPGCVRRGEKRVRGVQKAAGSPGFGSDRDDNYELGTGREYGPEETVADWDCVEGCAVRLIESQSEGASRFFYQVDGVKNNPYIPVLPTYTACQKPVESTPRDGSTKRTADGIANGEMLEAAESTKTLSINGSGNSQTVRCLWGTNSTILTTIKPTTICQICNLLRQNGIETTISELEKIIELLMVLNVEDVNGVKNTDHLSGLILDQPELTTDIAKNVTANTSGSGGPGTKSTALNTHVNIIKNIEPGSEDDHSAFLNIDPDPLFYCAKVSRAERNRGLEGMPLCPPPGSKRSTPAPGRKSALGNPRQNGHPTVKPLKLMRYLVRLVTPPGGTVLDPFAGSGTTLVAAKEEGFRYIGIELEPEYVEIAEARLAAADRPPATLEDFAP